MRVEDCYLVGTILKPHHLHGECKAYFDVDEIEDYKEMESVYLLQSNKLTPFFIERIRIIGPNQAIVQFKNILDRTTAESLPGSEMYLPLDQLDELGPNQFYYHEIKGFKIVDAVLGELGTIVRVDEFPSQVLLVMNFKNSEVLIPIAGDIVGDIDREAKTIQTKLPEGLLEIYISPSKLDVVDEEE